MWVLVNTRRRGGSLLGIALSVHQTREQAAAADSALQRRTRQAVSAAAYEPTRIVKMSRRPEPGGFVFTHEEETDADRP